MKKALALTIISALFISALAGPLFVSLAKANPLNPPEIVVSSPQNNKTYYSTEVQLNFTPISPKALTRHSVTALMDTHA